MSQIITKGLADNAVTAPKMRIANNVFIPMRNAANSADINSIKINASDAIEFGAAMNFGGFNARNVVNLQDSTAVNALNIQDREVFDTAGAQALNWANPGQIVLFKNLELDSDDAFNIGSGANRLAITYTRAISATGVLTLNGGSQGSIDAGTNKIINVVDPTNAQDVATKNYVDAAVVSAGGATVVKAVAESNLTISNPGTAIFDGVTVTTGQLVLLWNQTSQPTNGVYVFDTSSTPLVRATSWDASGEFTEGRMVYAEGGTRYGRTTWALRNAVAVVGTNNANFDIAAFSPDKVPENLVPYDDATNVSLGSSSFRFLHVFANELRNGSNNTVVDIENKTLNGAGSAVVFDWSSATDIVSSLNILPLNDSAYNMGSAAFRFANVYATIIDAAGVLSLNPSSAGDIDAGTNKIINLVDPTNAQDAATKNYVDSAGGGTGNKETFTLVAGDITNQYIDLANVAKTGSIHFIVKGLGPTLEGASYDYSVNYTGGAGGNTRITFLNDLATGGASALVATDVVQVAYFY